MLDPRVESEASPANDDDDLDLSERPSEKLRRDKDLLGRENSKCRKWLAKKIDAIARGFEKQADRSDKLCELWDLYNCQLGGNQYYNGTAEVFIPAIRDAVDARATRFTNQLFPNSGRHVDCTSSDGVQPFELLALLNHYIIGSESEESFKVNVVEPLFVCTDVEGQSNLYVDWNSLTRDVVSRETRGEGPDGEIIDITEEEIEVGFPGIEVLHDSDVLVLPAHSPSVLWALQNGGSATIVRRWSKSKAEAMVEDGEIEAEVEDLELMRGSDTQANGLVNVGKALAKAVGVRDGDDTFMTAFETWLMVPYDPKKGFSEKARPRLCRLWWELQRTPLGLKRNPYWNDRCPLLSKARKKLPGVFKGASAIEHLAPIQYEINDAANERADVDHMSAMPLVRRDAALAGNRPAIIAPGAVWDGAAGTYEFMQFPDLSQRAKARVLDGIQLIFQGLNVNPSMIPQQTGRPGSKRNQAEIAMEQQVDLLTVAVNVTVMEDLLNQVLGWFVDLDHQFRDRDLTVRAYGYMGLQANMIEVPPIQNGMHYHFRWIGAEQARQSVAMAQQGTAFFNLLRGMGQQLMAEGMELSLAPFIEQQAANLFGPTLAAQSIRDKRHHMSIPPEQENEILGAAFVVPTSPFDNHQKHLQSHMMAKQQMGDPAGCFDIHIRQHMMDLAKQNAAATGAMARPQGAPGVPGGAGPGVAGTPRPGAIPALPRPQGPPGMMHQDQMPRMGAPVPPRRA